MTSTTLLFIIQILILNLNLYNIQCYETYLDGFYNSYLPGSPLDPLQRPNTPFFTDTNRYSDGGTSFSYFDVTSSHFSLYNSYYANTSTRYINQKVYQESANEQGVAIYGLGDARNEDASRALLSKHKNENIPIPKKSFAVYAAIKWNPSNFAIREGDYYNITVDNGVDNVQYWYDGGLKVTSTGYESYFDSISSCYVGLGRCRPYLKKKRRLTDSNWLSLCCAIGQYVRPLVETEPGKEYEYTYLPLDESELIPTLFYVGNSISFRAAYTGQLICFANDANTLYWNNAGFLNVTVTRTNWPPTSNFTYDVPETS